jgi:hypothetical protein
MEKERENTNLFSFFFENRRYPIVYFGFWKLQETSKQEAS